LRKSDWQGAGSNRGPATTCRQTGRASSGSRSECAIFGYQCAERPSRNQLPEFAGVLVCCTGVGHTTWDSQRRWAAFQFARPS